MLFKCKICGGSLELDEQQTIATCQYCGTKQTLPKLTNDRRTNMYDRANHFLRNKEFDKAMGIYEQILGEDTTDAEAYWSIILCRYGIEYVEDPATHRRVPTVNRAQFTSVFDDENYKSAIANAAGEQREIYEAEANTINEIQKGILAISQKEEPFDVFICYKETDANGRRTQDSALATELYHELTREGFKVFFSRITLEDKLGVAYEPYIFAALNSAKVMVVLGTRPEHFNAVWVKNEWSRYLALIKNGAKKTLIPAYKDMDPYDLPEEFSHLQALDMSRLGFMQDLTHGIKKIVEADAPETTVKKTTVTTAATLSVAPLLKRAFMFLEDGDFDRTDEFCEHVLNQDPENAEAYLGKLMAELHIKCQADLANCAEPFDDLDNYRKIIRFADNRLKAEMEGYITHINKRNENNRLADQYTSCVRAMNLAKREDDYVSVAKRFAELGDYKNSATLSKECFDMAEIARKDTLYNNACDILNDSHIWIGKKNDIKAHEDSIKIFESLNGWKDSEEKTAICRQRIEQIKLQQEQERLEKKRQAEIDRIEAERKAKRNKKIAKIVTPIAIAIIAFIVILNLVIIPNSKYSNAVSLMDDGKYKEAISVFEELDGYKDSDHQILECQYKIAIELIEDEKYENAKQLLQSLAVSNKQKRLIASATALNQIKNNKFEDAIKTLLEANIPVELTYQTEGGSLTPIRAMQNGALLDSSITLLSINTVPLSNEGNVVTFNASADFAKLETPNRNGYRFLQWVLDTYVYNMEDESAKFSLTLKAKWSAKDYIVNYDLAGGSINGTNISEYDPEDKAFTLINPTRTGYTFAGWIGTDLSVPTINVTVPSGSYGDRSYTATWSANQYTVTYDAAGGSLSSKSQSIIYDTDITHLIPQRTGYKFLGWYENDTIKHDDGKWIHAADLSLVAKWEIINYTIQYELSGGSNHQGNPLSYNINTEIITLKEPCRVGYTFIGWTSEGQSIPEKNTTIEKGSTKNKKFVANWIANSYVVTLDPNNGIIDGEFFNIEYDSLCILPIPQRTGYVFAGWYYKGKRYDSQKWDVDSDATLTANWTANTYQISYDANGGSLVSISQKVTFNETCELYTPVRKGFTFLGWYLSDENTEIVSGIWNRPENVSVKAKWKANSYVITLDSNGGNIDLCSVQVEYNDIFSLPTPTWDGYVFWGWYKNQEKYTATTYNETTNITLVAMWNRSSDGIVYSLSEDEKSLSIIDYIGDSTEITIPESYLGFPVTSISAYGFANHDQTLARITIPSGITLIEKNAFRMSYVDEVIFEITKGWKCYSDKQLIGSQYYSAMSESNLNKPDIAAARLYSNYCEYYWIRE